MQHTSIKYNSIQSRYRQLIAGWILAACIVTTACKSPYHSLVKSYKQLNTDERRIADTLLTSAFDHEALYTLADTLKPMSSVKLYRLPIFSTDAVQCDSAIKAMQQLQHVVNKLSFGDFAFILNPFEQRDSIYKHLEVYVLRKSRLQSLLRTQSSFYSQLGITENALPATVLAVTEYEGKYNRWRSYGYLFGYPSYAVDFFVTAGKQQDSTGQFVKRDFFHIPVYAGNAGYFTYAVPKGYKVGTADSLLYKQAKHTLEYYKKVRAKHYPNRYHLPVKIWRRLIN
ncbi:MAG TPA: hypothetical protein PKE07_01875 [Lacibacter sp.]|nr:hypothetical protein [Lacibacter sp.]HMO87952.1 hypothetical protein [Lacibacter sp.]